MQAFLVVASEGSSLVAVHRLLIAVVSLVRHSLGAQASAVVVHGLSCPVACEIFLDQGLNLCLGRQTPIHCTTRKVTTLVFNVSLFNVLFCRHASIL